MNKRQKGTMELNLDSYKPLREIVVEALREAIIKGEIKPGTRMREVQLAEKMGVSRTPVREAIRQLELEELVVMVPRKGAYAAGLSKKDVVEVLEIRRVLEGMATELAAKRATQQEVEHLWDILEKFTAYAENNDIQGLIDQDVIFHDIIHTASRNDRLLQLISGLREQVQRFRVAYISQFDRAFDLVEEHRQIVEAISNGNSKMAREIAELHIQNAKENMIKALDEEIESIESIED